MPPISPFRAVSFATKWPGRLERVRRRGHLDAPGGVRPRKDVAQHLAGPRRHDAEPGLPDARAFARTDRAEALRRRPERRPIAVGAHRFTVIPVSLPLTRICLG